jgi:hypothetical protein
MDEPAQHHGRTSSPSGFAVDVHFATLPGNPIQKLHATFDILQTGGIEIDGG